MEYNDASKIAEHNKQSLYIFVRVRDGEYVSINFEKVTIDNGYAVKENRMKNGMYISVEDVLEAAKYDQEWGDYDLYSELSLMSEYEKFRDLKRKLIDTDVGRNFVKYALSRYGIEYTEQIENSLDFTSNYKFGGRKEEFKNKEPEKIDNNGVENVEGGVDIDIDVDIEKERNNNRTDIREEFNSMLPNCESVVYTLKLLHRQNETRAFYVGRSSVPKNRITQHLRKGGDFVNSSGYMITGVKCIDKENEISERSKYEQVNGAVSCPVFGGK